MYSPPKSHQDLSRPASVPSDLALVAVAEAMRVGDYQAASVALLAAPPSTEKYLAQARLAEEAGDPQRVLDVLGSAQEEGLLEKTDIGAWALAGAMTGCAYQRLKDRIHADRAFAHLGPYDSDASHVTDIRRAEIEYYVALGEQLRGNDAAARKRVSRTPRKPASLHARYLLLRGATYGVTRLSDHVNALREAVTVLRRDAPAESALLARAGRELALISRETPTTGALETLSEILEFTRWNTALSASRFEIARTIAWTHALNGKLELALRTCAEARNYADTVSNRLANLIDHTYFNQWAGERTSLRAHLAMADALLAEIDWHNACDADLLSLIAVAELQADQYPEKAASALYQARKTLDLLTLVLDANYTTRYQALINAASCRIVWTNDRDHAIEEGSRAYRTLSGANYAWRAARVALDLHELTRQKEWLARADEALKNYDAQAPMRIESARRRDLPDLQPRAFAVLEKLHTEMDRSEIAKALTITVHGVNSQVTRLYKAFNVTSRPELIAKTRWIIESKR